MQFKRIQRTPALLALAVLLLICGICLLQPEFSQWLEWKTYDLRMRAALHFPAPVATNLAFVAIEDSSIRAVQSGKLGYQFGLEWPRQVFGRLVNELSDEGARSVAFDVQFGELRSDYQPPVQMANGQLVESDAFFALQCRHADNVILATTPDLIPPELFATNAMALGDITTEKDSDGVLRRVKAFRTYRLWNSLFKRAAAEFDLDLGAATIERGKIILPQIGTTNVVEVPVDPENNFNVADFAGDKLPPGVPPREKAFRDERVWHMGVILAAQELKLDLARADVDLPHGRITLHGANGVVRVIPVDSHGFFYVDWRLKPNDPHIASAPIENLLWQDRERLLGQTNGLGNIFRNKLVVVGSAAQGNNLTDRGATPLEKDTLLVSKHWNVANSIITNRFIGRAPISVELGLIVVLALFTALLTWQLRAVTASLAVLLLMVIYIAAGFFLFVKSLYWLPLVLPVLGAILVEHVCLVSYRVMFEEREQRRVKSVFSKIVAPEVVNELLGAKKLSLGGVRREITVFFADIRGFTAMTDETQERITEFVLAHKLDATAAEACFDEAARDTLDTVNRYLAVVADAVKQHGGTLDKYIGDCVMAFWGAPAPNEKHALACVRAAIDTQRTIHELNEKRLAENTRRDAENRERVAAGKPALPLHTALQLGSGINTGLVAVGLMGSDAHILNYTVFGRDVNVASRLESVSGSGRIIISDTTYNHLLRDDPDLAATCIEMFPVTVKGIRAAVRVYEVPWNKF